MNELKTLAEQLPIGFIQGLVVNGGMTALAYFIVWRVFKARFAKHRIQKLNRVDAAQIKFELKNALIVITTSSIFTAVLMFLTLKGHTQIYTAPKENQWLLSIATVVILWFVDDFWFYMVHRFLHHPKIFKAVHLVHHKSIDVNPFTSLSFHWLEPLLLTSWIIPVAFLFPIYAPALGVLQLLGLLENIKSHLGYEFYPKWWNRSPLSFVTASTFHNLHHTNSSGNYGLHTRIWDKLLGTEHAHYEAQYDEVKARSAADQRIFKAN
jgi:Delta7-sterol 5-desaturase